MSEPIVSHPRITPVFKHSQQAFEEAIKGGRLSADPTSSIYAENFMYMGTWTGRDAFKHIETRKYLGSEVRP
jgi:hypothetical protein